MPATEIDKVLAAELTAAKSKEHNFVAVAKGPAIVHLLLSKTPIKEPDVQKAKKESGGNALIRGKCLGAGGTDMVFRVIEDPGVEDKKLKDFIVATTNLSLKPRFEIVKTAKDETAESEGEENTKDSNNNTNAQDGNGEASGNEVDGEAVMKRFNAMSTGIKAHLSGPHGPDVQKLFVAAGGLLKTHEYAKATKVLDALDPLLAEGTTSGNRAPTQSSKKSDDDFPRRWATVTQEWQTAIESVNQQISELQAVLRKEDDDDLQDIAEFGLNGVTGNFKTPLMIAMREVDSAGLDKRPQAIKKVAETAAAFLKHLNSDERVAAVDDNPFNVKLSVRKTLSDALAAIGKTLQAGK